MKIGFIGAGKVGFSMGKYLTERAAGNAGKIRENGTEVTGYYSRSPASSAEAARFTGTKQYLTYEELVRDSDAVFLTVNDAAIESVWEQIRTCPIAGRLICHFSGALSSGVFSGITQTHAYGYSIHPLLAVHDRYHSHRELSEAFFTIEGTEEKLQEVLAMVRSWGNRAAVIDSGAKTRYHAAAAIASNLYVGLADLSEQILTECGFTAEEAHEALRALIAGNTQNILDAGCVAALTGPVERCDAVTVQKHLDCLGPEEADAYRAVSRLVLRTARKKNPETDYSGLERLLAGLNAYGE